MPTDVRGDRHVTNMLAMGIFMFISWAKSVCRLTHLARLCRTQSCPCRQSTSLEPPSVPVRTNHQHLPLYHVHKVESNRLFVINTTLSAIHLPGGRNNARTGFLGLLPGLLKAVVQCIMHTRARVKPIIAQQCGGNTTVLRAYHN